MLERLRRVIMPPVFAEDEEQTRVARVLNALLLLVILALCMYFLATWFVYVNKLKSLILFSLIMGCTFVSFWLMHRGQVRWASLLFLAGIWTSVISVMFFAGGPKTIVSAYLLTVTIFSALLLSKQASIIASILSGLATLGMVAWELSGHPLPLVFPLPNKSALIDLIGVLFIVTVSINLATDGFKQAIASVREQLAGRKKVERALRATSLCNQALVHCTDRESLFDEICKALVEEAGYSLAWFGLLVDKQPMSFAPAACHGAGDVTLSTVFPIVKGKKLNCQPMQQAVRRQETLVLHKIDESPFCHVCFDDIQSNHLTSLACLPLTFGEEQYGAMIVYADSPDRFTPDELKVLQEIAGDVAYGIQNLLVREDRLNALQELEKMNLELAHAYDSTLQGWSQALELRERETAGHSQRVVRLTLRLAEDLGVPEEQLPGIRWGAYLHDIGKIGIPDTILLKPDRLTDDEWNIMHQHPVYAYNLISSIPFLKVAVDIPYFHHERWNGSGYPDGLHGEDIPLAARIFAVVDVWDALINNRPYRPAWSREEARKYLHQNAGVLFDPQIVAAFLEIIDKEDQQGAMEWNTPVKIAL